MILSMVARTRTNSQAPRWADIARDMFPGRTGNGLSQAWRGIFLRSKGFDDETDRRIKEWVGANGPMRWDALSRSLSGPHTARQLRDRWEQWLWSGPTVSAERLAEAEALYGRYRALWLRSDEVRGWSRRDLLGASLHLFAQKDWSWLPPAGGGGDPSVGAGPAPSSGSGGEDVWDADLGLRDLGVA